MYILFSYSFSLSLHLSICPFNISSIVCFFFQCEVFFLTKLRLKVLYILFFISFHVSVILLLLLFLCNKFIHLLIYPSVHSFINSYIHSFIHSLLTLFQCEVFFPTKVGLTLYILFFISFHVSVILLLLLFLCNKIHPFVNLSICPFNISSIVFFSFSVRSSFPPNLGLPSTC